MSPPLPRARTDVRRRVRTASPSQCLFVRLCTRVQHIADGAGHTRQFALPGQRQGITGADLIVYALLPAYPWHFLSQPNSIFDRPISEYRRSGLADWLAGFRPRLASNMSAACRVIPSLTTLPGSDPISLGNLVHLLTLGLPPEPPCS